MNWLTALANALRYYLEIKAVSARYDLSRRIESDVAGLEGERDRLRGYGDPVSQRAADRVQDKILRAQSIVIPGPLPAAGPPPASGPAGANG